MKKITILVVLATLLAMAMAMPAYATKPIPAQGDYAAIGPPDPVTGCIPAAITGSFDGVMNICKRPGKGAELGYFVGAVEGRYGTAVFSFSETDHWTIMRGESQLASLHGHGTVVEIGWGGTYSGEIHFDP